MLILWGSNQLFTRSSVASISWSSTLFWMPIEIRNFFCRCQPSLLGPSSFQFEPQHHLPFNTLFLDMRSVLCKQEGELFCKKHARQKAAKYDWITRRFASFPQRLRTFQYWPYRSHKYWCWIVKYRCRFGRARRAFQSCGLAFCPCFCFDPVEYEGFLFIRAPSAQRLQRKAPHRRALKICS